jgi:hypothetical protein
MGIGPIGRRDAAALIGGAALLGTGLAGRRAVAQDTGLAVSVRDAVSKLVGPARIADDPAAIVSLAAARNEFESAQVVLQGTQGRIDGLRVRAGALTARGGGIPAEHVETFLVHYASVDRPSDSRGARGRWPDALVPLKGPLSVRADVPSVLWIRVRVPKGAAVGTYDGALALEVGGRTVRTVPISLRVFAATLPDAPTLPFVVGLDFESIHRLDGGGLDAARFAQRIVPAYYAALRDAGATPFVLFDAMPAVSGSGASLRADFATYDRRLEDAYGGRPQVPFPVPFALEQPIPARLHRPFTPDWDAAVIAYLGQAAKHLEARGDLERAFIYLREADEPTTREHIGRIVHLQRLVRAADRRLRMVQTIHVRCFDCVEDAFDLLDGDVTLWTPNIAYAGGVALGIERVAGVPRVRSFPSDWQSKLARRRRGADADVWWYLNPATTVLPGPHPGYPSLHVDHDGMAHRALAWTAWSNRVTAVGHWMATYWRGTAGPWERVPRGEGDGGTNGDGVLLYPRNGAATATGQPDPGGPTPSVRLELIREGGEDHKLITLAERAIGRGATERLVNRVATSIQSYSDDPGVLRSTRLALLEAASR